MGFGEAKQQKSVVIMNFKPQTTQSDVSINIKKIPCFQPLVRIIGSLDDIHARLEQLKQDNSTAWLEIEYTGTDIIGNLWEMLDDTMADSPMEILRIKNKRVIDRVISNLTEAETLDDLDTGDVFKRCLDAFDVLPEDRNELTASYNEIITGLLEEDRNAE